MSSHFYIVCFYIEKKKSNVPQVVIKLPCWKFCLRFFSFYYVFFFFLFTSYQLYLYFSVMSQILSLIIGMSNTWLVKPFLLCLIHVWCRKYAFQGHNCTVCKSSVAKLENYFMQDVYYHFRIVILLFIYRHSVIKYRKDLLFLGNKQRRKIVLSIWLNLSLYLKYIPIFSTNYLKIAVLNFEFIFFIDF